MTGSTYVLVPGAGGMASFWKLVQRELDRRGLRNIAVDLPGDDESKGLPAYVDLIVEAAGAADDVVIVAQSLGGFAGSWAATRLPTSAIVLLNAMIPVPGETAGQWWSATRSSDAMRDNDVSEGRDPDGGFDPDVYFFHDVPASVLAGEPERGESDAVFADAWDLPRWPDLPTRVIAARDDRLFPLEFQRRVARERLGLEIVEVPGGHLAALSRPVEVTEAIVATHANQSSPREKGPS